MPDPGEVRFPGFRTEWFGYYIAQSDICFIWNAHVRAMNSPADLRYFDAPVHNQDSFL